MSMILLPSAYKMSQMKIKRRIIPVSRTFKAAALGRIPETFRVLDILTLVSEIMAPIDAENSVFRKDPLIEAQ
jgi:hypothetical protein